MMNDYQIIARTIKFLALYFQTNFVDESNTEDKECNPTEYGLEAFEILANYSNKYEAKSLEILSGKETFESFSAFLEESDMIDQIIDRFEAR